MHEVSIIHGLLEAVMESAAAQEINRVTKVCLVVGDEHNALPDNLHTIFAGLARDTVCEGAELEIVAGLGKALYVDYYEYR